MTPEEAPLEPRRLVILRHAKAEPYAADDHGRALSERGRGDAADAGIWAADQGLDLDVALVSSALRTRETWECFAQALDCDLEPDMEDALYSAGPESVLEFVRALPDETRTALFVGHNPTAAYLVQLLNDGEGDPAAINQVSKGYPTAAITVLEVPGAWRDLELGGATIRATHVGRGR